MRKISAEEAVAVVAELALKSNFILRKDVLSALNRAEKSEKGFGKSALDVLISNARIARENSLAICQDTGMAVVFCEIGRELFIRGDLEKAINKGIKTGYEKGYLRKSVVADPLTRKNTNTNTPCVIHYDFVKGDKLKITVLPKGFGSENASGLHMFKPTDGPRQIIDFCVDLVKKHGQDACPPLVLGVGIGGTADTAALLAKKALLRHIGKKNPKKHIAKLEHDILLAINKTGIGPAGLGGKATCLWVNVLTYPTHIAGLPVCVNIGCHAMRSASASI